MNRTTTKLSLDDFLNLPESDDRYELVDGELKPKVSQKFKYSITQLRLLTAINDWCEQQQIGRVLPEWGVLLQRSGNDWVPVPDLTYVSYQRLSPEWDEDAPCPVLPELVIEIISPGQSFGELTEKAEDYLSAGIDRIWVVDPQAQSVTVFRKDGRFETLRNNQLINDSLLPELELRVADLFSKPEQGGQ
ncbi:MAG: Uma2 family endonuclease [Cyanobacteria bacterium QH_8_48_120]|jgi:Uma2 family endonuclease|nr:MAG: Uma2 family endonuclease [Cyanobacteria bacterium QH_6_48_35]PSO75576.1 MAG: Uma2 family endonuclease [Cyanobacteria bacterium QH_8_48_120]PSO99952.1 MAG: Uma2 family endonuclease [Cyanobacteria bacterium QS_7_48_42]PSP09274.1 MAG: Uma2 family endonuclease [Cyanobacteria bacterium SW_10_48_33]PSP16198.1 MAG: Uma2 family endonuclease [Cyanobacteria bacterium SW_5_48_44]